MTPDLGIFEGAVDQDDRGLFRSHRGGAKSEGRSEESGEEEFHFRGSLVEASTPMQ
jgi:hypothetical protein